MQGSEPRRVRELFTIGSILQSFALTAVLFNLNNNTLNFFQMVSRGIRRTSGLGDYHLKSSRFLSHHLRPIFLQRALTPFCSSPSLSHLTYQDLKWFHITPSFVSQLLVRPLLVDRTTEPIPFTVLMLQTCGEQIITNDKLLRKTDRYLQLLHRNRQVELASVSPSCRSKPTTDGCESNSSCLFVISEYDLLPADTLSYMYINLVLVYFRMKTDLRFLVTSCFIAASF